MTSTLERTAEEDAAEAHIAADYTAENTAERHTAGRHTEEWRRADERAAMAPLPAASLGQTGPGILGRRFDPRIVFFLGLLLSASGLLSPPLALVGGILFGFLLVHPYQSEASSLAKVLLQLSVVLLGFGVDLHQVLHAGRAGFLYTAISIGGAAALGLLLGRVFRVGGKASYLISFGTAICGGSAIAAIAPITDANEEEISVAMGTVFLLNSAALLLFPAVGWYLHLSQSQFGLWAALAIHDTSSVVGAAAKYGAEALAIGTTVKLVRALWIVPVSLATAAWMARATDTGSHRGSETGAKASAKVKVPWFILFFVGASVVSTYLPQGITAYHSLNGLGKTGLTATLFLIGTSLSKKTLRTVGVRPFLQGVLLWIAVGSISLLAIVRGWIAF